jgi:flagellin-like protein
MSIKNMLRSKKAISPILATLLLIVIAVAAIVVTYAWIMAYMGTTTQQAEVKLGIANVNFNSTSGDITIDIQNTGTSGTEISAVYVGTSSATAAKQMPTQRLPLSLGASQIVSITIQDYNWVAGETYYFKVVSTSGQAPYTQVTAP